MAERIALSFDDGYKELEINGDPDRIIKINPADMGFLKRLADFDKLVDNLKAKYGDIDLDAVSKVKDIDKNNPDFEKIREAAENVNKLENAVRELIDDLFGYDISSVIFGSDSCLSLAGGQPIFLNFIDSIVAYINSETKKEADKSKEKISKYTHEAKNITSQITSNTPNPPAKAIDLSELTPDQIKLMDYLRDNGALK